MVPDVITKATTGSGDVLMMLSMCLDTDCPLPRLRLHSSSIVRIFKSTNADMHVADQIADQVAEAAVVGVHDELTGQAVNAFVALKEGTESNDQVKKDLMLQVRKSIGPFAAPKAIFVVPDLPKTRSGKIMRRIMRKILAGEEDQLGDITTVSQTFHSLLLVLMEMTRLMVGWTRANGSWQLSDPSVVEKIIEIVHQSKKK